MVIRQEREQDYKEVYKLVTEAFAAADHADGNEQDLVEALRKGSSFIPELSLLLMLGQEKQGRGWRRTGRSYSVYEGSGRKRPGARVGTAFRKACILAAGDRDCSGEPGP